MRHVLCRTRASLHFAGQLLQRLVARPVQRAAHAPAGVQLGQQAGVGGELALVLGHGGLAALAALEVNDPQRFALDEGA